MARVALACNLIRPEMLAAGPLDAIAELDTEETVRALEDALRAGGHEVVRVEADERVCERLRDSGAGIVFNVAEGVRGESRESHVPAVCEMLGLPYTGSGVLATALCLDKARTREVLLQHGIRSPGWRVFAHGDDATAADLRFPLIVTLLHEGSSMGLTPESVVDDEAALRREVARLADTYRQAALVEEFIEGREFTVGVLGNRDLTVLPIVELTFDTPRSINLFRPDDPVLAMAGAATGNATPSHGTVCPAEDGTDLGERIRETARRAYRALGCRDWRRLEIRQGPDGELYMLELNPIAGLDPDYLLPRAAAAAGWSYPQLVNRILDLALERAAARR